MEQVQSTSRLGVLAHSVRGVQLLADVPLVFFRQMSQHVANLVYLASLHDGRLAGGLADGCKESFAAVDDIQPRNFEIDAPLSQIPQQLPDDGSVLRRSLTQA